MLNLVTLASGEVLDVSAWPLPAGVEDGILNRTQLARAFSVSDNTITKWIAQGMPVLTEGQNGVSYEFRLSHCYAWRQERDQKARAEKARGDQVAAQAALAFRNLDADQEEAEGGLSADEVKKWSEAEYARNRLAEQRGDLVRADRVRAVMEEVLVIVGGSLDTLPDFMELNFSMTVEQVEKVEKRSNELRNDIRQRIEDMLRRPAIILPFGDRQSELDI